LKLSGEGGGDWWLDVSREKGADEATLVINEGPKEDAKVVLECAGSDFVDLFTGKVKAMNLVNAGKIKFSGPMTEGVAFLSIWNIPKPE
jgi:putative sterol carrier protein